MFVQVKGEVHILGQNVTDWALNLMLLDGIAEGFPVVFPIYLEALMKGGSKVLVLSERWLWSFEA